MKPGSNKDQDNSAIVRSMLRQIKSIDPAIGDVINKEIRKGYAERKQQQLNKEIIRRLRIQTKKLLERKESLKEQLNQAKVNRNQLLNRMRQLRKLNKTISDALGSCSICWGEDFQCPHCGGKGKAGWRNINMGLFNKYVIPSIMKVENSKR
jgi:hypothetical protein